MTDVAGAMAQRTGRAHPVRASLAALRLTDFRNYANLSLRLDSRPVVLTGANGAGKTNLLEAISFLSPGRGLRRAKLDEVTRRTPEGPAAGWAVSVTAENAAGSVEIGTGIAGGEAATERQRQVRVNRAPAKSSEALLEHLRVVWLTPAMDGLFTGPASDRRRFLDRLVLAIDRAHGQRVNAFERATRGRNRILEDAAPNSGWLDAVEAQMAELGTAIAAARVECVGLLGSLIGGSAGEGPFPAAGLALRGDIEAAVAAGSATAAEDGYRRRLAGARTADRAAGRTLAGPHLSDLDVTHVPKAAPAETCSTGEQKALLVGLVLAHARLIAGITGETPLILLDEVAAHLDARRRAGLFDMLIDLDCQAFLTGTDAEPFAPLGEAAQHFTVRDATVLATAEAAR
jgi:DNA replication and repair protein RecF